jgi:hypothetical protein
MPKGSQPKIKRAKSGRSKSQPTVASTARRAMKTQPKFGKRR